ncbi:MAG: DUF192 domain-containing protein [Acidobacteria bacterium]|nr:DUF192 domain-containing protein [Acidobacteriota bacterium]
MIGTPRLYHTTSGACLAERLEIANTAWTRLCGLMFRRALAQGHALWIRPCNGVHTFWMRFAIDVVYLDREMRIVKLIENLRPFRLTMPQRAARSVIELPAHTIVQTGIQLGDQLRAVREGA